MKNFHRTDTHNNDYIQRLQKMIRHMITHTQNFNRNDNKNVRQSLVAEYMYHTSGDLQRRQQRRMSVSVLSGTSSLANMHVMMSAAAS